MRDILLVLTFGVALIYAVRRPFWAIIVYYWMSLMAPHRYSWGFSYSLPFAQVAALVTVASSLFHHDQLSFPNVKETYFVLMLWVFIAITSYFSIYPTDAWAKFADVSKIFIMIFFVLVIVNCHFRLQFYLLSIVLFVGFLSVKGLLFGIATGGRYTLWGPQNTNLEDNNFVGVAMTMLIPLCFFLYKEFKWKWLTYLVMFIGLSSVVSAILTYSRGALLGLASIGVLFLFVSKKRIWVSLILIIFMITGFYFMPSKWFERMSTIQTYQKDSSANQRLNSWAFSFNIARARILGGGFRCYTPELYQLYAPDPELSLNYTYDEFGNTVVDAHTSHSIYFEMMAEHGFLGFSIFLICLFSMLISLNRLYRLSRNYALPGWVLNYSRAISCSLIAFMVSGAFVSRAFFELFWVIYASGICLIAIVQRGNFDNSIENIWDSDKATIVAPNC